MKCTSSAKSRTDANMQLTINSFRSLFSDEIFSPTLSWHLVQTGDKNLQKFDSECQPETRADRVIFKSMQKLNSKSSIMSNKTLSVQTVVICLSSIKINIKNVIIIFKKLLISHTKQLQYKCIIHFSLQLFNAVTCKKSLTFPWQLSKSLTLPGFPYKWSACPVYKGDLRGVYSDTTQLNWTQFDSGNNSWLSL